MGISKLKIFILMKSDIFFTSRLKTLVKILIKKVDRPFSIH